MRPHRNKTAALAYATVAALMAVVLVAHQALATVTGGVTERGMALAGQLAGFDELAGRSTPLAVNGQRFFISTRVVDRRVDQVLARVIRLCGDGNRRLAGEMAGQLGAGSVPGTSGVIEQLLVPHERFEDGGAIAVCIAGLADGGLAGLVRRLGHFARSMDVSDLGRLRVIRLRPHASGTHVLLVGADERLSLNELLPERGQEVVGDEVVPGVRPPFSTRFITAKPENTPHYFTAYRSSLSAAEVFGGYRRGLLKAGYAPLSADGLDAELPRELAVRGVFTGVFRRGHHAVIATSTGYEHGSLISVLQLADAPDPQPYGQP
ncbi:MAG: hypothetical protein OXU20_25315 [Myxococcales bacterium]|nr:hypothetical protein [Myxococcales bacterium]